MMGTDQYGLTQTTHRVYRKRISQIARETGHHRNAIRKVIARMEPAYRRPAMKSLTRLYLVPQGLK